jgi:murein DD-endopeptidase MepM/ murein hydrolase activator NlpD
VRLPPVARRTLVVLTCGATLTGVLAPAANASVLDGMLRDRRRITADIGNVREAYRDRTRALTKAIERADRSLVRSARGRTLDPQRWRRISHQIRRERWETRIRLYRLDRYTARRVKALLQRRQKIGAWLDAWAVFRACPVGRPHAVADNFGITVRLEGVPIHRHMGNDISAPTGTPIVAPFDGYASASSSPLGGLEVRVKGARGYVYNAHLMSYGRLGYVRTGAVIGYVGSTGDATAPHDHFEWHPWDGGAVDPNPYLDVVC